jgi:hypothetical protein
MNEIEAIRDFYRECTEAPSDRIWRDVERRTSTARSRHLQHPLRVPLDRRRRVAVAAALVGALAAVLAFLPASRHSRVNPLAPKNASAATVLRRAAAMIAGLPDLEPGQFLYSRGTRTVISSVAPAQGKPYSFWLRENESLWVSLDGTLRDQWTSDPKPVGYPTASDRAAAAADPDPDDHSLPPTDETSSSPRAFEQSFGMTLAEMRSLLSDPARLTVRLRKIDERWKAATPASDPTRDDPLRVAISVLIGPSRPAVKAALLDALAELHGVRRLPDESLDGERVFAIAARFTSRLSKPQLTFDHVLLLDPATGQLRGARYVSVGSFGDLPAGTTTSQWEWQQAIVTRLGERPSATTAAAGH